MKVLYIVSRPPDWFSDIIYFGLKELGVDIIEYPYHPTYHCSLEEGGIAVKDEHGKIIGRENKKDGTVYLDKCFDVVTKTTRPYCNLEEKKYETPDLDHLDSYDFVVAATYRWDTIPIIGGIINKVKNRFCLIDGEDDPFIRSVYFASSAYFKRELMKKNVFSRSFYNLFGHSRNIAWTYFGHSRANVISSLKNIRNCIPLPQNQLLFSRKEKLLSLSGSTIPYWQGNAVPPVNMFAEKEYDISMMLNCTSNSMRQKFASYLKVFCERNKLKCFIKTEGSLPWNKYLNIIQKSKCCVSMPGMGYDTIRYWEIPCYGAALISPFLPIEIHDNFTDMESAIFFQTLREFEYKVSRVLKEDLWLQISRNGANVFKKYHLPVNRAQQVLSTFERM